MTPTSEATLRLLSCFVCFQTDRQTVQRNLGVAARLCAEVRSVEAQLTRTASTAEIFRKLGPHLGVDIERQVPPYSPREMISEFRSFLRKHKTYAFKPRGGSMRPFLKSGDSLRWWTDFERTAESFAQFSAREPGVARVSMI